MPPAFRERAKYIQDFAKHGFKDLDEDAVYEPKVAEAVMIAAIVSCEKLYGKVTPLMALYSARFFFENPDMTLPERREHFLKGAAVYDLGSGSRKDFLDQYSRRAVTLTPP
jgi:hypothetical protein